MSIEDVINKAKKKAEESIVYDEPIQKLADEIARSKYRLFKDLQDERKKTAYLKRALDRMTDEVYEEKRKYAELKNDYARLAIDFANK